MLDINKENLNIGDTVAYATMSYRSAELRIGEIIDFTGDAAKCRSFETKKSVRRYSYELAKI